MDQQGRFLAFLVLSTLILVGYHALFPPPPPSPRPMADRGAAEPAPTPAPSPEALPLPVRGAPARPAAAPDRRLTVETSFYTAVFESRGARLSRFILKKYRNRETGDPIELVHPALDRPKPFELEYAPFPGLSEAPFAVVEGGDLKLSKDSAEGVLVFRAISDAGIAVEKRFTFTDGTYLVRFDAVVRHGGKSLVAASPLVVGWPGLLGPEERTGTRSYAAGWRVETFRSGGMETEKPKKSPDTVEFPGPVRWTAVANQFFTAALLPDPASGAAHVRVVRDTHPLLPPEDREGEPVPDEKLWIPRPLVVFPGPALAPGEGFRRSLTAYVGPQEYDRLKTLNAGIEKVVDFGIFEFLCIGMLKLLQWFHGLTGNWGVAILLLSLLVKLVLWWPTHSSYRHMSETQRKMRELQPRLEAIKRKFADDRQRQNQEIMKLYQTAGVNPMGGCLPMLLQIPVFFALYSTLVHAIELRDAPFALWIRDLSLKDPLYVLPVVMGATMFLQQKVSGSTAASTGQQKFMSWFFPIFLTFISFQFPAGLLLYWIVTNVLSIVQQKMVNHSIKKAGVAK